MKTSKLITVSTSFVLALSAGVLVAHAQGYTPLAPITGIDITNATPASDLLPVYLSGALKLLIALGGVLSVLMAVIAGTKYVAAGISPDAKSNAKSDMTNALIGLALILSSYLILNSINPNLVALNFSLTNVSAPVSRAVAENVAGAPWGDDTSDRNALKNASGIDVNKSNCANVGDTNCTSVYGISLTVLNGLKALSTGFHEVTYCAPLDRTTCKITVTGGTEYWLHGNRNPIMSENTSTFHKPGGNVVDLSISNDVLNGYIKKNGLASSQTGCAPGNHYEIGTAVYVDEQIAGNDPHWHVCY